MQFRYRAVHMIIKFVLLEETKCLVYLYLAGPK